MTQAGSVHDSQEVSPAQTALKKRASVLGQAFMFIAALFWGSNPAALRYLYTSPGPPDAAVLSAAQTGLAAAILLIMSQCIRAVKARRRAAEPARKSTDSDTQELIPHIAPSDMHTDTSGPRHDSNEHSRSEVEGQSDTKGLPVLDHIEVAATEVAVSSTIDGKSLHTAENDIEAAVVPPSSSFSIESGGSENAKSGIRYQVARLLNWSTDDVRVAGLELGLLTFTANAVTIIGFALATASRGAFLLRSSIVSTPILSTLAGISVAKAMWGGAVLGFTGSVLISTDPVDNLPLPDDDTYTSHVSIVGDLLIVCAAVLWSGVMVRQSRHASCFPATDLAAAKLTVMACMSFLWLISDALYKVATHQPVLSIWAGFRNPVAWLVLLWPAIGPWSTAEIAQIEAQSRISASHGQIILAIDPLISVAFAGLVNKAEQHLGVRGWFGGALLVVACLVASQGDSLPVH